MNKEKLHAVYFPLSMFALGAGCFIYYFFRNSDLLIYHWFDFLPRNNTLIPVAHPSFFINFIRYNLPCGLWVLSGLFFLRALWHKTPRTFVAYRLCFLCIAFALEIAQLSKKVAGTFDIFDLFTIGSIALLESVVHTNLRRRRQA